MIDNDTIVAIATARGVGGIGIVRLSGPAVRSVGKGILGRLPRPREAEKRSFKDESGRPIDHGIALFFPQPASYTGEDVLELHGHGGPVVLDMLVERAVAMGARPARPGEFTERAFLNEKLDLTQAEAVADLIESHTRAAARSALRSLEGEFSRRVEALAERLASLRVLVESAIDFPEEELDFPADGEVGARLISIREELNRLLELTRQGNLLQEGLDLVLAGLPNAGKSSLLNAITGHDRAIVSPRPGTTRDTIDAQLQLEGLVIHVTDTAGLRSGDDDVEQEGVRRAQAAMARADHILLVVDDSGDPGMPVERLQAQLPADVSVTLVLNKIDLSGRRPGPVGEDGVAVSAKTGAGLEALRRRLRQIAGWDAAETVFSARRRHVDALGKAREQLDRAIAAAAAELVAEDLRGAHDALGEITGRVTSDELLGRIFATFCIGK